MSNPAELKNKSIGQAGRPQRTRKAPSRLSPSVPKNASGVKKAEVKGRTKRVAPPKKQNPKRVPKGKKQKDANAPKKNKSAYMFYCQENRAQVKEENPEMKATEITKKLGAQWKSLEKDEKAKYDQMAAADKQRYQNELHAKK